MNRKAQENDGKAYDGMFSVRSDADFVAIGKRKDGGGYADVLYWDSLEWEEDPSVTVVIAEAIRQAYEEPEKFLQFLYDKKLI